jgi:hypothetical protein
LLDLYPKFFAILFLSSFLTKDLRTSDRICELIGMTNVIVPEHQSVLPDLEHQPVLPLLYCIKYSTLYIPTASSFLNIGYTTWTCSTPFFILFLRFTGFFKVNNSKCMPKIFQYNCLSSIYNISGCVLSDIQTRAELSKPRKSKLKFMYINMNLYHIYRYDTLMIFLCVFFMNY